MKKYVPILQTSQLFSGVQPEELESMLHCLQAKVCHYPKGAYVFRQGEMLDRILVLANGKLHIQRDDYWGNCSIMQMVEVGELCGEAYAAPGSEGVMYDVLAVEASTVITFDVQRILTVCSSACRFHTMVVQNLFLAISEKNRKLLRKLGCLSQRSTREKLIVYLSEEARRQGSSTFTIPFNRQQLADFLSVDRSAMSAALCKMRDDGMLTFQKNRFTLL